MNTKRLKRVIQEIVRREVKKEINKIFIKENSNTPQIKPELIEESNSEDSYTHYTENETLNKILNETKGFNEVKKTPEQFEEYPSVAGGPYDTNRMAELLGYGTRATNDSKQNQREFNAVKTLKDANVKVDDVPEHITNALTRDYSGLMKAIKDKR